MTNHNWVKYNIGDSVEIYKCSICFLIKNVYYNYTLARAHFYAQDAQDFANYLGTKEPSCDEMLITNILL